MNGHESFEELIATYGDLVGQERARVDAHLRECRACAERLASFERVDDALGRLCAIRTPTSLMRPLATVLADRAGDSRSLSALGPLLRRSLVPAFLAVLVISGLWLAMTSIDPARSVATATPTQTLTPTATLVSATWGGAREIARAGDPGGPLPMPVPAPPEPEPAGSKPSQVFFVTHLPRATIVR